MNEDTRPFLDWIDAYRQRRQWNHTEEFARAASVAPSVLSRWFGGTRPRPEMIFRMAEALGEDRNNLMQLAGYVREPNEDSPEIAALTAKLRQITWAPERFLLLEILLDGMRRIDPDN